jgi:hypothetical protein
LTDAKVVMERHAPAPHVAVHVTRRCDRSGRSAPEDALYTRAILRTVSASAWMGGSSRGILC